MIAVPTGVPVGVAGAVSDAEAAEVPAELVVAEAVVVVPFSDGDLVEVAEHPDAATTIVDTAVSTVAAQRKFVIVAV